VPTTPTTPAEFTLESTVTVAAVTDVCDGCKATTWLLPRERSGGRGGFLSLCAGCYEDPRKYCEPREHWYVSQKKEQRAESLAKSVAEIVFSVGIFLFVAAASLFGMFVYGWIRGH